ncbi:hypothetical protein OS493_015818 [Desmophyllum pertusum]|uniref:Uncharacterized protein n=1 Tax=Desmophyllum pertusum TaxID=174260 RepID=A0A9X0CGH2_9CNID|nr:hypothetical protein OS493_015818 [Desmophyllum pertusum]
MLSMEPNDGAIAASIPRPSVSTSQHHHRFRTELKSTLSRKQEKDASRAEVICPGICQRSQGAALQRIFAAKCWIS